MSIRIEVEEDGTISILRSWITDQVTKWLHWKPEDASSAIAIVPYLIRREIRRVAAERFVPQVVREGRSLLKRELKQREHIHGKA